MVLHDSIYLIYFFFERLNLHFGILVKLQYYLFMHILVIYNSLNVKKRSFYEHTCESDAKIPFKNQILMNAMIDSLVK